MEHSTYMSETNTQTQDTQKPYTPNPIVVFVGSILKFIFSFDNFHLWRIAVGFHAFLQLALIPFVLAISSRQELMNSGFFSFFQGGSFFLWLFLFFAIRITFELILVVLGIHQKLCIIADTLQKIEIKK